MDTDTTHNPTTDIFGEPDRWEHRTGGGWKAWRACLPFILLAGLSSWLGWAYPEHFAEELGELWYYINLTSSVGAVLLGLVVLSFRAGATIDRTSGEVVAWWGLFGRWFQRWRSLEDFTTVVHDRHVMRMHGNTRSHFVIRLEGAADKLNLVRTSNYCDARRNADQVALLTGFRYLDRAEGAEQEREPDSLIAQYFYS